MLLPGQEQDRTPWETSQSLWLASAGHQNAMALPTSAILPSLKTQVPKRELASVNPVKQLRVAGPL